MIPLTGMTLKIRVGAAVLCALTTPHITAAAGTPAASSDASKEERYQAMIGLAQQMAELKPLRASDLATAALYEQLRAAYQTASDSFGGDDPGRVFAGGLAAPASGAATIGPTPPAAGRDDGGIAGSSLSLPGCATALVHPVGGGAAIPDNATVTRTVNVVGATGPLWYVDSVISITHTFAADLDISLTSPAGTTITISTDNGGSSDNVFQGSLFQDSADFTGAVPYVTNNGLVTDHAYVNGVSAGTLAPEEPLHAFVGEDPNGTWTLTITDDAVGDIGVLQTWDVFIITMPAPSNQTSRSFSNTTALPIADFATAMSSVTVAGMGGVVCDVDVAVNISHTFAADLQIALTSPNGLIVSLSTNNGGANDNVFAGTRFDNSASPGAGGARLATDATYANLVAKLHLTPEESLSLFRNGSANGVWRLAVADTVAGDVGTLNSWSLTITTCTCRPACPGDSNGDGNVDVNDLLGVVSTWGGCP